MSIWTTPSAVDPRLRVQARNSTGRRVLLIVLDQDRSPYGAMLARHRSIEVDVLGAGDAGDRDDGPDLWDRRIDSQTFDVVMLVATAQVAPGVIDRVGASCTRNHVKVAVILVSPAEGEAAAYLSNLAHLRPWADSVALVEQPEAVIGMLQALGV